MVKWLGKKGVEKVLEERDNKLRAIEFENVGLQGEIRAHQQQIERCENRIAHLQQRYVDYCRDPGKDNIVIIIEKNSTPEDDEFHEYPYYIARIQRRLSANKRKWFQKQYPNHRIIVDAIDNPNSIHSFNRFEENKNIEKFYCHFRLVGISLHELCVDTGKYTSTS